MDRNHLRIRRFNSSGIERMINFTDALPHLAPNTNPPWSLLSDNRMTTTFEYEIFVSPEEFNDRYEVAAYFNAMFNDQKGCTFSYIERDTGLWTWFSLMFFDKISKRNSDGTWKGGDIANWIPHFQDWKRYYRHLLAGPSRIYNAHIDDPEITRIILLNPPDTPGEVYEQLASRMQYATNPAVLKAASKLYLNKDGRYKRGAAGKDAGSARRLALVLAQLDVTWDLYSLSEDDIIEMLPREFNRFIDSRDV